MTSTIEYRCLAVKCAIHLGTHSMGRAMRFFYFTFIFYTQLIWSHTPGGKKKKKVVVVGKLSIKNFQVCFQSDWYIFSQVWCSCHSLPLFPPSLFWALPWSYLSKGCDKRLCRLQIFDVLKCNKGLRSVCFHSIFWLHSNSVSIIKQYCSSNAEY